MNIESLLAILSRGLEPFAEAGSAQNHTPDDLPEDGLPEAALARITAYKRSLVLVCFKSYYGHSLYTVAAAWEEFERYGNGQELFLEEFLSTLHFYSSFPNADVLALHFPENPDARFVVARSASIVARMFGKKYLGVAISPAIVTPDKSELYYYTEHEGANYTERRLTGIKLAQDNTRRHKLVNSNHMVACDLTVYVLHHPNSLEPGQVFLKCGPIEKRRGRNGRPMVMGLARTMKNMLGIALQSETLPPPSELTVIVAVTNSSICTLPSLEAPPEDNNQP